MFNITRESDGLILLHITGRIDAAEMESGLQHLFADLAEETGARILFRMDDAVLLELSAIAVELRHLPHMLRMMSRIDRVAVLSDEGWVRTGAEIEGRMIPGVEIRSWPLSEEAEARAWAGAVLPADG
jgi:hypothetical protein